MADNVFPFYVIFFFCIDFFCVSVGMYVTVDLNRPMVTLAGGLHAARRSCCFKGQTLLGSA